MAKKQNLKLFYSLSFAWQLGFLVVVPIGGFMFVGYGVDRLLATFPLFLILGVIVGLSITVYEIYHLLVPLIKEDDNDNEGGKDPEPDNTLKR
jgi:F0F1-type ATP synthase assembly protein I